MKKIDAAREMWEYNYKTSHIVIEVSINKI